jgi:hypothetical protein
MQRPGSSPCGWCRGGGLPSCAVDEQGDVVGDGGLGEKAVGVVAAEGGDSVGGDGRAEFVAEAGEPVSDLLFEFCSAEPVGHGRLLTGVERPEAGCLASSSGGEAVAVISALPHEP